VGIEEVEVVVFACLVFLFWFEKDAVVFGGLFVRLLNLRIVQGGLFVWIEKFKK